MVAVGVGIDDRRDRPPLALVLLEPSSPRRPLRLGGDRRIEDDPAVLAPRMKVMSERSKPRT